MQRKISRPFILPSFLTNMKLFFRKYGSGQPLIILHGLFGQSDNWNTLAKKYAESGFEVFVIDQRNHGLSPHSEEWTYEAMAADLKELIDAEKISSPALIGHSMGGKTVMFFELLYPGIAKEIIVADIAPRAYPPHHKEVLDALLSIDLDNTASRKEAEEQMSRFDLDFGTKQFLLKNLYWDESSEPKKLKWRFNLKTIHEKYASIGVRIPGGRSDVRALFVKGERSDYISATDEAEILRIFPRAEFATIKDAGHWVHAEKPQQFFDETIKFLNP